MLTWNFKKPDGDFSRVSTPSIQKIASSPHKPLWRPDAVSLWLSSLCRSWSNVLSPRCAIRINTFKNCKILRNTVIYVRYILQTGGKEVSKAKLSVFADSHELSNQLPHSRCPAHSFLQKQGTPASLCWQLFICSEGVQHLGLPSRFGSELTLMPQVLQVVLIAAQCSAAQDHQHGVLPVPPMPTAAG